MRLWVSVVTGTVKSTAIHIFDRANGICPFSICARNTTISITGLNGRCQHIFCALQTVFRHYLLNSASAQPQTIKALCKRCVNLVPTPFIQVARRMVLLQFAVFAGISDGLSIYFGWVLLLLLFQQMSSARSSTH